MARGSPPHATSTSAAGSWSGREWLWVLAFSLLAAVLRFANPGQAPPGLNQDEAINAWNAWCLLKTGHDMTGASWPVFYSHAVGDNRTTLFFYLLIPFQALFGLSAWSARLPAAFFGTLSVPLAAYVARRWFGRGAGAIAAALLAVDPWHLLMSRIALEGSVTPFLALLPIALLTAAGLLPGDERRARVLPALASGLAAGIATYGYWSMRLWVPAWLVATVLLLGPAGWKRARAEWRAWLAFALGLAITFGPLLARHLTDPAIARRAEMTRLWSRGAPLPEIARLICERWLIHFGPRFLWTSGDMFAMLRPAVDGAIHRFMVPLLLVGLAAALIRFRRSPAARAMLALLIAYPAGDLVARYDGVHELRSAAGIGALVLLAAFGARVAWDAVRARGQRAALVVAISLALAASGMSARSLAAFYGSWGRRPEVYAAYRADIATAARWLAPQLKPTDTVFCTTLYTNDPWAVMLVELGYDPRRWFAEPREVGRVGDWEVYPRIGNLHFIYSTSVRRFADELQANGRDDRVWFIVRPEQLGLRNPVYRVRNSLGEVLWVCRETL